MISFVWWSLFAVYAVCCIGLIVIVLLQKGKGTGFAGAFGVGAGSDTVFGPRMSKSLPVRLTYIMAALFVALALIMSLMAGRIGKGPAPKKVGVAGPGSSLLDALDAEPADAEQPVNNQTEAPIAPVDEPADVSAKEAPEAGTETPNTESTKEMPVDDAS